MQRALLAYSIDARISDIRAAYREASRRAEAIRDTGLDVSSREQVGFFLDALNLADDYSTDQAMLDRIGDEFAEGLVASPPRAVPGAGEALAACRAAGTRTALVSNTGQTPGRVLRRILRALDLAGGIDVWVFSDEIRLSKPIPAIFRHVLGALHSEPGETLFVGDTPELDVIGARAAGMPMLQVGYRKGEGPPPDYQAPDLRGFAETLRRMGLQLAPSRSWGRSPVPVDEASSSFPGP
jgi:putative hydrolase of the HAD superfamily